MRVLREGVAVILVTCLLAFAAVSTGVQAKTIYDIEMDRYYVSAAKEQLASQYAQVKEKLDIARSENDVVATAEYEMILDTISLIDRRVNMVAIGDQVEQTKEAFIEDQWSKFVAEKIIGAVGYGLGRIGFGKVTDTYMKGKNWPPRSNFVTYNPVTNQNVRIILGGRPELTVTRFSDEISDFGKITLEIFDKMRSEAAKNGGSMSPYDAQKFISEQLEKIEGISPLPSDISIYIASSMIKQGIKEGGHIGDEEELDEFARDFACQKLTKMATEQSTRTSADVDRSEALWAAVEMVCGSSSGSITEEAPVEETAEEEIVEEEEVIKPSSNKEIKYEGRYTSTSQGSTESEGDFELYIFPDGSATGKWRKDDTTFWQSVYGTHVNNNYFDLTVNETVHLTGNFNEDSAQGCTVRVDGVDSGSSLCFNAKNVK
jgi:hypothetical protein